MNSTDLNTVQMNLQKMARLANQRKHECTNEAMTRSALIEPFVNIVLENQTGESAQIIPEYPVGARFSNPYHVDYAIMEDGNPIIYIEAKKVNDPLKDGIDQILKYGELTPTVAFVALTNGIEWQWFKRNEVQDPYYGYSRKWSDKPFLKFNINSNFEEAVIPFLNVIRRDNFDIKSAVDWADQYVIDREIDYWLTTYLTKQMNSNTIDEDFLRFLAEQWPYENIEITLEKIKDHFPIALANLSNQMPHVDFPPKDKDNRIRNQHAVANEENFTVHIANGETKVLNRSKRPRAWRINSEEFWRIETNSTDLLQKVVQYFARIHENKHESFFETAAKNHGDVSLSTNNAFIASRNLDSQYCINTNNDTKTKREILATLANLVVVDGKESSLDQLIDLWMPEIPSKKIARE